MSEGVIIALITAAGPTVIGILVLINQRNIDKKLRHDRENINDIRRTTKLVKDAVEKAKHKQ